MHLKIVTVLFFFLFVAGQSYGQSPAGCTTLGQTPATAFPICTKDTFVQTSVPICSNKKMLVPGCPASTGDYADKNPFWYRFTCYQTGTFSLFITPNNLADDYDWQLYDVTGITDLNAVYTTASLFVVGNWSGSSGVTGASVKGTNRVECASDPRDNENTFSAMPFLQKGHNYLLLVSHFSDSQSGYSISFLGGSAVINNPDLPDLQKVQPSCDATVITLKLNLKIKCSTLATDGSDFTISPAAAKIIGATGGGCSTSFDMDSVTLTLSNPLPPDSYKLIIQNGTDANTLLDDCDRDIPAGHELPFTIVPLQPTPLDSISPVTCAPSQLQLVFQKNIRCGSIAADGSDFVITGPAPIAISSASGTCNSNSLSSSIILTLASPVVKGGVYQVKLLRGIDGNTIIDECGQETPVASTVSFTVKDTVSADFDYQLLLGCKADTVAYAHNGNNDVNQWQWFFGADGISNLQTPVVIYKTFGKKQVTLAVSNGFCTDTITKTISLNNALVASFVADSLVCPDDGTVFKNNSIGDIINYNWNFGDGNTSALQTPTPENFPKTGLEKNYLVQLIVENGDHCFDTTTNKIKVLKTCYIAVPNAFTPNGDGNNDYLYPLNALKADNLEFNIYNRLGQLIFHSNNWLHKWDGKINGQPQNSGTYVWTLRYTDRETGKKVSLKGTSVLIK